MVQRVISGNGSVGAFSWPTAILVRSALAVACLIGMLVLLLSQASAQDARGEARQACRADYSRLCAGVSPGDGRVRKCLNDNFDALSSACKQAVSASARK